MPVERAAQATTIASPAASGQLNVGQTVEVLYGWSIAETSGAATAAVRIRDGKSVSGNSLSGRVNLAANESVRDYPEGDAVPGGLPGIQVTSGALYVDVISGSVEVTVWWG